MYCPACGTADTSVTFTNILMMFVCKVCKFTWTGRAVGELRGPVQRGAIHHGRTA